MAANTVYLGDSSEANWVTEGTPVEYGGNSVLLTMAQSTVGTLLSSTKYVWYGKISATMRSAAGAGVVTAFIMMSDVKDEIDFEFIGTDLQAVQSNYYWQGTKNYTNSANLTVPNTNTDWHTYEIDWQEDSLTWSVDGKVLRTLNKADTIDSTGKAQYPQTPSRIMISLWPAGLATNGQGTVDWSGGLINWNSAYMQNGYYYAQLKEVTVECAKPPSDAKGSGSKAYSYSDLLGMESSVVMTNNDTVLSSFYASGDNPTINPDATSSKAGSSATPVPSNVQTIPGVVGGGVRGGSDDAGGSALNGAGNGNTGSSVGSSSQSTFVQGVEQNQAGNSKGERAVHGSAFAVLVAFVALVVL